VMLHELWRSERGFTLVEVMTTIIVMGIVFAIASSTWLDAVESRRVDWATNQVVSELRQAHTSATTRLEDWRVEVEAGTRDYRIYRIDPDTGDPILLSSRLLPERTAFPLAMDVSAIVFKGNGEAEITTTGSETITVAADDGAPSHTIEVNLITSRIDIDG